MNKIEFGRAGEEQAVRYLKSLGCVILERNFRCRYGEIDIIAMDGDTLCFVEVKTRRRTDYGLPCQAVDARKEMHIRRCAYVYTETHTLAYSSMRIDIVEILYRNGRFYARRLAGGRMSCGSAGQDAEDQEREPCIREL